MKTVNKDETPDSINMWIYCVEELSEMPPDTVRSAVVGVDVIDEEADMDEVFVRVVEENAEVVVVAEVFIYFVAGVTVIGITGAICSKKSFLAISFPTVVK